MSAPPAPSEETRRTIERAAGELGTAAVAQLEADHAWYRALPAQQRSWVGVVAQAGIRGFLEWFGGRQRADHLTSAIFGDAPRDLARAISLGRTLELLRTVVDVVERDATALAPPGERAAVRESILRYSREVAFAAAEIYARAAESRGAYDARLESLVVDAIIRGEADDSMESRAAALGWGQSKDVLVLAGATPPGSAATVVDAVHRKARQSGIDVLVAVQGRRLVCVLSAAGARDADLRAGEHLAPGFGDGPIVVGPVVPHLYAAGRSARAALSGLAAAPAWPDAPRVVRANDLLAERALLGEQPARAALQAHVYVPLRDSAGGHLLTTAAAWLDHGAGVEGTARLLFVHANTVRYRLAAISRLIGYDLTDPHDAQTVRLALAFGRLVASPPRPAGPVPD